MSSITRWVEPAEPQQRERQPGPGQIGQTEREWSQLIAMLELAQRWQEPVGAFTGEDAHLLSAASASTCLGSTAAAAST